MEDFVAAAFDKSPEVAWLRLLLTELVVATDPDPDPDPEEAEGRMGLREARAAKVSSKEAVDTSPADRKLLLSFLPGSVTDELEVVLETAAAATLGSEDMSTKLTSPSE